MAFAPSWTSQLLFLLGELYQLLAKSFPSLPVVEMLQNYGKVLHVVIISRRSWDYVVFISERSREELLFWRDNLVSLNGILFWPTPLVSSKIHFLDASLTGCGTFVQGFDLISMSEKLVK